VHPSAALLGPVFLAFVAVQGRFLGPRGLAWRTGLAALCALGPTLVLPILSARGSIDDLGLPNSLRAVTEYVFGSRFTAQQHVFGWTSSRASSFGQYLWEEMLGVG